MRSSSTRLRRALALTAVAGITVFGPAMPASAQPVGPPPLRPTDVPGGPLGTQPGQWDQTQGCMQGNPGNATIEEKPWSQLTLGFEEAHEQNLTGQGKTVAVIDTGVNQHPRLTLNGGGGSAVPGGGANLDCDGHGTIVSGIIAAHSDPSTGFVGVAPDATILSIRQSSKLWQDKQEKKGVGNTQTMAQAIQYAANQNVSVINISQSSCQSISQASNPSDPYNNMLHQAVKNAHDKGIVVVAAAGNAEDACQKNPSGNPTTAVLPAWFDDYVLTVASVGQQGQPSEFTVPGPWVDVAAPGENLISLDPGKGGNGLASQIAAGANGQMQPLQGTSFAAPYVSGLAVLIKEKYPELDATEVMDRIKATALHPGGNDGRNDIVGYGMVDFMAALSDVVPGEYGKTPKPVGEKRLSADVIPQKDWPALMVAVGGALGGVAAVIFTAFLVNAVRNVRAREAERSRK